MRDEIMNCCCGQGRICPTHGDTTPEEGEGYKSEPELKCPCRKCNPNAWWMVVCHECGNKRCPHATDHHHPCTGSNDPDQKGSVYNSTTKNQMNKYASLITQKLSEKHAYTLTALLEHGDLPISKLAVLCGLTPQGTLLLIDRLEELGYVCRTIAKKTKLKPKIDRRVKLVSLKPRGRSFAKTL